MLSEFSSTCTLPPTITNWVSSPNTRGTFDILSACLITLFLCTWSVQHPNVPSFAHGHEYKSMLRLLGKNLIMMLTTLITPEFLLLKAIADNAIAGTLTIQIEWRAKRDRASWSKVHSYFTNMGGFVIDFPESMSSDNLGISSLGEGSSVSVGTATLTKVQTMEASSATDSTTPVPVAAHTASRADACEKGLATRPAHSNIVIPVEQKLSRHQTQLMRLITNLEKRLPKSEHHNTLLVKGALCRLKERVLTKEGTEETIGSLNNTAINLVRLRTRYWALDAAQLMLAREMGIIDKMPNVEIADINEKSNSDGLAKFLAVLQTLWQIAKLLERWVKHEPSSQIEVVTVAYCACTFLIYIVLWSKPQQVTRPYSIPPARCPTKEEMIKIAKIGPVHSLGLFTGFQYDTPEHAIHTGFENPHQGAVGGTWGWVGGTFGGVLFGLLHVAAWDFQFPTVIERSLWRIASTVTSAIPTLYSVRALPAIKRWERQVPFLNDSVVPTIAGAFGLLYALSRLFLLVETFRSLAFLAPGSYKS